MYTSELNVDAALHELFAYARQYQYEVSSDDPTLCIKKSSRVLLEPLLTMSNVNRFSKLYHCWKEYEIATNRFNTSQFPPQQCMKECCGGNWELRLDEVRTNKMRTFF